MSNRLAWIVAALCIPLAASVLPASAATIPCATHAACKAEQMSKAPKAKVDPSVAASIAAAAPAAVTQTLAGAYVGTAYAADYGMKCDGLDDDTAGLNAVLSAAQANSGPANAQASGIKVILPGGLCIISGAIKIVVTKSMTVAGLGIGTTHLQWVVPTGGFAFTVSNGASLTVDDMTISKKTGVNPTGSTFVGEALSIAAGGSDQTSYGTPLPRSFNVGSVTVANLSIYPGNPNGQTDGWAVGVHLTDLPAPTISNVSVNMPGYVKPIGALASPAAPGPFSNGPSLPTSGATAANSSAAAMGIGVADGVLLQGSAATKADPNAADYSIDAVVSDLTTTGGLVGLDLYRFQGAYVSSFKSASDVIGIRADTPDNVTELLSVMGSLFTDTADGIYANGVAGINVNGNYFIHSNGGANAPAYAAIWLRNGTNATVTGNNINGDGKSSPAQEYGIFFSNDANDGTGGFPNSVNGNVIFSINDVCIGNDKNVKAISASGNSLVGCTTPIADGAANIPYWVDDNSYTDNVSNNHPDMVENGNGLQLPEALTVGSFADVGTIKVLSDNVQTFLLDGSGNLTAAGALTVGGSINAGGSLTAAGNMTLGGSVTIAGTYAAGNASHSVIQEVAGGWGGGGSLIQLRSPSGGFPQLTGQSVMAIGELYCISGGFRLTWHVIGHWALSATSATVQSFQVTPEPDVDTTWALQTLKGAITPQADTSAAAIDVNVVKGFGGIVDCTADLHELTVD